MENKTENTALPLYKVLEGQRTKGEWNLDEENNTVSKWRLFTSEDGANIMWLDPDDETKDQAEANAAFTVLAVNNLVPLAEALQNLYNATCNIESSRYFSDELRAAKEALNKIS